jgi:hypothetical protein
MLGGTRRQRCDHVSNRADDDLRKVISQTIDLACDAVEFLIEVIEPRML